MNFEEEFKKWLEKSFEKTIPDGVIAFSFNLYEPAGETGVKFGIEIVGASGFDPHDPDWACEEIWEPDQRQLFIPIEYSSDNWEVCLERMKVLTLKFINSSNTVAEMLKSKIGIGIGFVDGEFEIIWQP